MSGRGIVLEVYSAEVQISMWLALNFPDRYGMPVLIRETEHGLVDGDGRVLDRREWEIW